jgi:hypothetical protein
MCMAKARFFQGLKDCVLIPCEFISDPCKILRSDDSLFGVVPSLTNLADLRWMSKSTSLLGPLQRAYKG